MRLAMVWAVVHFVLFCIAFVALKIFSGLNFLNRMKWSTPALPDKMHFSPDAFPWNSSPSPAKRRMTSHICLDRWPWNPPKKHVSLRGEETCCQSYRVGRCKYSDSLYFHCMPLYATVCHCNYSMLIMTHDQTDCSPNQSDCLEKKLVNETDSSKIGVCGSAPPCVTVIKWTATSLPDCRLLIGRLPRLYKSCILLSMWSPKCVPMVSALVAQSQAPPHPRRPCDAHWASVRSPAQDAQGQYVPEVWAH